METRASRPWMLTGVALILLVGLIHLMDAPDSMTESTTKGLFFYANFVGAIVAAVGIFLHRTWGWALGILVAAGAFIGYIVSRTVGIFDLPPDVWMEPLGIASLVVEALFIVVALRAFTGSRPESPERAA
jgi:uncharacterized membrane protein YfcA